MLRTILTQATKSTNFSALTAKFCTRVPNVPILNRREVNDVKIIGTLITDSHTLASGTKALTVKTRDSPVRYSNHNIHIRTTGEYTAGQRVYITGKLNSSSLKTSEGKLLTASIVKANQLYVLENESGTSDSNEGDENSVQILANVASEISIRDKDSSFSVATHFIRKNENGEDTPGTHFHRIFAYKDEVRQYINANLKKSDRILVKGQIRHQTNTEPDGKKLYSGYIAADNIFKVARRTHAEVESNESIEEKQAN